jgi:glutathione peroxidase
MRTSVLAWLSVVSLAGISYVLAEDSKPTDKPVPAVLSYTMKSLAGEDVKLSQFQGKVILIINTASECGFTPQYEGLQALYTKYKDKGLVLLGFPANDFGQQEPGTDSQIATFCKENYGVTFPIFRRSQSWATPKPRFIST